MSKAGKSCGANASRSARAIRRSQEDDQALKIARRPSRRLPDQQQHLLPVAHGRLVANNRHDGVMLANIGVHDEAHRGFRAIHKMNNIRPLSEVIWGNSRVMRWRHCWQVGTTSSNDVEAETIPAFHRKRSPFDV